MEILYLIVGRGGSKGIPGKNLQQIAGTSLVAFKAIAARGSRYCSRLIVSSDDPAIRDEARRHGAEVLFERPHELATDSATSVDVVLHALDWIEANEGRAYGAVMLLEPSSPFATPEMLDRAAALFIANDAALVVGVREVEVSSAFTGELGPSGSISSIVSKMAGLRGLRRQDQDSNVTMNGAFYLIDCDSLRSTGQIYGVPERSFGILMDRAHSVEIDTPLDLEFARLLVANGHIDLTPWSVGAPKNLQDAWAHR